VSIRTSSCKLRSVLDVFYQVGRVMKQQQHSSTTTARVVTQQLSCWTCSTRCQDTQQKDGLSLAAVPLGHAAITQQVLRWTCSTRCNML
jgi:hypothetical protein